jgi:diguanylate cyclase (GGDEF)-like protein
MADGPRVEVRALNLPDRQPPAAALGGPDEAAPDGLLAAALEVHRQLDLPGQLEVLARLAASWTGARAALALAPAEERGNLAVVARFSPDGLEDSPPRLKTAAREVLRRWFGPDPAVFEGLGPLGAIAEPSTAPDPAACVVLPLHGTEQAEWVALLVLTLEAPPPAAVLSRLAALERELRPAIGNAIKVGAMRELVIRDDTARCFNRRYFESSLPDELARATRFHAALSLIFLDMDNLKEVNKRHGHAMGSRTLLEVSQRIRAKIRRFDRLFRFGGDEFCVVLPETDWHGAIEVAERVRDAIAGRPFLVNELGDPNGVRMTASLGIASYPLHARTQQELVEQADRAMQRIKNGTKNGIGIAEIVGENHAG